MGNVNTNDIALQWAREQTPGVLPAQPVWRALEPNDIDSFGNEVKTTTRNPISRDRQRRKPVPIDNDSTAGFTADLTLSGLRDFLESFLYAQAIGPDTYEPTAVAGGGFTVPAVSAAQAGRLIYSGPGAKSLIYSRGWATLANNGLKVLGAAVATNAVSITAAGLTNEALPAGESVELSIAGVRAAAGDLTVTAQGNIASTALNFTTLGLTPGQHIWVGGLDVANQFFNAANSGLARVKAITANLLTLERRSQAFVADDGTATGAGGAGVAIDLLFGQFVRNVPVDHADYRRITNQIELASLGLGDAGETLYEYGVGLTSNELTVTLPLTEKATIKLGFVGSVTTDPAPARAQNAAAGRTPDQTEAFSTASDIARLRAQDVDESGLTSDFKSLTIAMRNNVQGEKVLGFFGSKYRTEGTFEVDVDAEVIFSSGKIPARIRSAATVGLDFSLVNGDGGVHFDIPSGTFGNGKRNFKTNETVKLQTKLLAFKDEVLGYTMGVSIFPVLPNT